MSLEPIEGYLREGDHLDPALTTVEKVELLIGVLGEVRPNPIT